MNKRVSGTLKRFWLGTAVDAFVIRNCIMKTYAVNQAKWKPAQEWCKDRLLEFKIITEKELGIK